MTLSKTLWAFSILAFASLIGCSEPVEVEKAPAVRATKYYTVGSVDNQFQLDLPAIMKAQQTSALAFTVPGYILDIPVSRGQDVRKGQLIARLDNRDYQSNLASAEAQYEEAETEYQRAKALLEQNAIARMTVDQRKAQRDVAKASLDRTKKAVTDTAIYAPFSGQISSINVEKFQQIGAGQTVVTLQNNDSIVAAVDLPASILVYTPQLQPKNSYVALEALPERRLPAQFLEASGVPNTTTQTYEVRFEFDAPDELLVLPGMTGTLHSVLNVDTSSEFVAGVEVPMSAVVSAAGETFVWLINTRDNTVSKRVVTIGEGMGDNTRITSGLRSGDVIAAAGASYMYDGMKVRELAQ